PQHDVDIFKEAGTDVERLGPEQLLSNARKYFQRSGDLVFLHEFAQHERSRHIHRLARVMSLSMSRRTFNDWIVIRDSRLLRRTRNAVDVRHERDHRLPRSICRNPCRRNARYAALDLEPVLLQDVGDIARRLKFLKPELGIAEDLIHHLLSESLPRIHL